MTSFSRAAAGAFHSHCTPKRASERACVTSVWSSRTVRIPAAASRGSAGPTAANSTTSWPRRDSPSALSSDTLAWPPLM